MDTAALQAALDACKDSGGTVFIPKGEYLASSLRIYINTEVRMEAAQRLYADTDEAHYGVPRGAYDNRYARDTKTLIGIKDEDSLGILEQLVLLTKRGMTDRIVFAEDSVRTQKVEIFMVE